MPRKKASKPAPSPTAPSGDTAGGDVALSYIAEPLRPFAEPLASLELDPKNARKHSNANILAIAASLKKFQQNQLIVVNRRNRQIVAGNGRYMAAQHLNWTHIAVLWVDQDPASQTGYSIADNRTSDLADWDADFLVQAMSEIEKADAEFSQALMLHELASEIGPAQPAVVPETKPIVREQMKTYQVVVECTDAHDRRRLLKALRNDGRRCRALTWDGQIQLPAAAGEESEST
jgi:hypothetical protein